MQKLGANEGIFRIPSVREGEDPLRMIQEVSDAYQRARARFDRVTVVSSGKAAAYAILLAERFAPDEVRIAPFRDGAEAFFRLVKPFRRNLFAVLADVTVYVSAKDSARDVRRLQSLLRPMRAPAKRLIALPDERAVDIALKNRLLCASV